ncbi:MAG: tetratricopeptide repeat protein, partial [Candidatus Aminicenantes bacterium]|nr:tetratricopeptide repeat protein [Candidatus Aminicenantes bacterium]
MSPRIAGTIFVFLSIFIIDPPFNLYSQEIYVVSKFKQADEALLSGDYASAIVFYSKGINIASEIIAGPRKDPSLVYDDLGYAYLKIGDFKNAKTYLKKSIRRYPENYDARFYLAIARFMSGEPDLALRELKKIEDDIYFTESWLSESETFQKSNGSPVDKDGLHRIRFEKGIHLEKKKNKTIIHLDAFDERNEGAFYFLLGVIQRRKKEFDSAERSLRKALDSGYDQAEAGLALADLYLAQNRREEALQQVEEILEKDKANEKVLAFRNLIKTTSEYAAPDIIVDIRIDCRHRLKDHGADLAIKKHLEFFQVLKEGRIEDSIKILEGALDSRERSFVVNHNLAMIYLDLAKIKDLDPDLLRKAELYCGRALWFRDF